MLRDVRANETSRAGFGDEKTFATVKEMKLQFDAVSDFHCCAGLLVPSAVLSIAEMTPAVAEPAIVHATKATVRTWMKTWPPTAFTLPASKPTKTAPIWAS